MTKRIILSLAMIALTIAGVTSATVAYFSATAVRTGNTFSMGTVNITQADGWGLPYMLTNMIPGEQKESGRIAVQNTGSMPIDLYVGERDVNSNADFKTWVNYAIDEVQEDGTFVKTWVNWQDISGLFSTWNKVGENIPAGGYRYYKVYVKPLVSMPNSFQGKQAITDVILYAVQHGYGVPSTQPWVWTPSSP